MLKRSMFTVKTNQESSKKDSEWVFLAEYSLDEFMRLEDGGDVPAAGMKFQEPGISQYLNPINQILAEIAQQAMLNTLAGVPGLIRLFCQEKVLNAGNPAETMSPIPTIASPDIHLRSKAKMTGGWGYFLVEKSAGSSGNPFYRIDLYLYKEGV